MEVPKSTATQAPLHLRVSRDRVDQPVSPELVRVVHQDRHAGLHAGAHEQAGLVHPPLTQGLVLGLEPGYDGGDDRAVQRVEAEAVQGEQVGEARRHSSAVEWGSVCSRQSRLARRRRTRRCGSGCFRRPPPAACGDYGSPVSVKLYVVQASHPCWAVKRALDLKGIEYKRVEWPPTLHVPLQRLRFSQGTVPGLVIDGEKVIGSRTIMHRLDELRPDPALYPAEPEERPRVEEADRWGDEVLQALARRLTWWTLRHRASAAPSYGRDSQLPLPDFAAVAQHPDHADRVAHQRRQRRGDREGPGRAPGRSRPDRWLDRRRHAGGEAHARTPRTCRSARASRCSTRSPTSGRCSPVGRRSAWR